MKKNNATGLILLFPLMLGIAEFGMAEPEKTKPAMRDAATHTDLARRLTTSRKADPMRKLKAVSRDADAEKATRKPKDLIGSSDILCYRGAATLVPKRAVLNVPRNLSKRLAIQPGAKIQTFTEFAKNNRTWIRTVEVSRDQANGSVLIDEKTLESIKRDRLVVIATFHGGPISVLPPKPDAEEPPKTQNPTR